MTKKWLLCATTAVVLIATPALAANEQAQGSDSPQVSEPAQATPDSGQDEIGKALRDRDSAGPSSDQTMDKGTGDDDSDRAASAGQDERGGQGHRMAQRRLRAALKDAGFTHIRIVDATYLIRAKDENGNTVMMSVNPSSMHHGGMGRGGMHHGGMRDRMDRGAMAGSETSGFAESGGGYGDEAEDDMRGDGGGHPQARGHGGHGRWNGGGQDAYERAYERGFREGYNRGFDSAQRR